MAAVQTPTAIPTATIMHEATNNVDALDANLCDYDSECYDCLDCDYEHYMSAPGTPALSRSPSATPAEHPSTPLLTPTVSNVPTPTTSTSTSSAKTVSVPVPSLGLGERLLSGLQALGSSALHAILPTDEEDAHLTLSPRRKHADAIMSAAPAFSPAPCVLLEPARPGAHVRFLVAPRASKKLPTPTIVAYGSSIFGTSPSESSEGSTSQDEEFEIVEDDLEYALRTW